MFLRMVGEYGPWILRIMTFENTVGKGGIGHNEQFLICPRRFLTVWISFYHFQLIQNCRLQILSVWKSLKFVVWERAKHLLSRNYQKYR